jgi:thiol-disulfide isomerase/thioredoxin
MSETKNDTKYVHVTTSEELDKILEDNKESIVVLDIYATWCGPCQRLAPHLDAFVKKYNIVLVKVDVDKVEHGREKDEDGVRKNELLRRFNLRTIPLIHVWSNGKEVYVGDSDHEKLEAALIEASK